MLRELQRPPPHPFIGQEAHNLLSQRHLRRSNLASSSKSLRSSHLYIFIFLYSTSAPKYKNNKFNSFPSPPAPSPSRSKKQDGYEQSRYRDEQANLVSNLALPDRILRPFQTASPCRAKSSMDESSWACVELVPMSPLPNHSGSWVAYPPLYLRCFFQTFHFVALLPPLVTTILNSLPPPCLSPYLSFIPLTFGFPFPPAAAIWMSTVTTRMMLFQ
jgi:hypothetical protein